MPRFKKPIVLAHKTQTSWDYSDALDCVRTAVFFVYLGSVNVDDEDVEFDFDAYLTTEGTCLATVSDAFAWWASDPLRVTNAVERLERWQVERLLRIMFPEQMEYSSYRNLLKYMSSRDGDDLRFDNQKDFASCFQDFFEPGVSKLFKAAVEKYKAGHAEREVLMQQQKFKKVQDMVDELRKLGCLVYIPDELKPPHQRRKPAAKPLKR